MFKKIIISLTALFFMSTATIAQEAPSNSDMSWKDELSQSINNGMTPVSNGLSCLVFAKIPMNWTNYSGNEFSIADAQAMSAYEATNGAGSYGFCQMQAADHYIGIPFIVIWLLGCGIFFSFYLNFPNIRGFKQSLRIVSGKYDDPSHPGEVTHFQALTAAVSGTVGLGNIAGVAIAVSVGGPGATFWMILAGLFGMSSKFVECTLGIKYREIDENGTVTGGPMMYLSKGLAARGMPSLGKFLAAAAALICIGGAFGAGAMFQVNQSSLQFTNEIAALTGGEDSFFYGKNWLFGIAFLIAVGLVIIGGIKKITHVTEFLVPIMAFIYLSAALVVIGAHIEQIPHAFGLIFNGAFTGEGVTGGIIGVLIQGLRRATFSNEAGLGSASIAHSAAKTNEPVAEGLVAIMEPFIDTVVICTITALVIIVTGQYQNASIGDGIVLTSNAFASVIAWFPYVLTIAVVMFAFSTSITWFYYGQRSFLYLVGDKPKSELAFKMSYLAALFIGSAMQLGPVMDIADSLLLAMGFPNIVGLYIMRKEVKEMMISYFDRLKSGEIKPYAGDSAAEAAE